MTNPALPKLEQPPNSTLMIVDDDESNLLTFTTVIEELLPDCRLITTNNPHDAVTLARHNSIDCALIDLMMPDIDGIELCRRLKTDHGTRRIPVILVTGTKIDYNVKLQGLAVGADDFIHKPYQMMELAAKINVALRIRHREKQLCRASEELESRIRERTAELRAVNEKLEREVRDRRLAIEALGESERLLEQIFASLDEAVFVVERKTRHIVSCNPAVEAIFGYSPDELVGASTECLHVDHDMYLQFGRELTLALNESRVFHTEFKLRRKDGSIFYSDHTVTKMTSGGQLISVVRDITERKNAQEQMLAAQKAVAIGMVSTGIAHEINQPLQTIRVTLDGIDYWLKRGQSPEPDVWRRKIDRVMKQTARIDEIIEHMRSLLTNDSSRIVAGDLNATVLNAITLIQSRILVHRIRLKLDLDESLPAVRFNPLQMEEVMINLLSNSQHALDASNQNSKFIWIRSYADDDGVYLVAEDNGPGFQVEPLRIFEPFYTTKGGGMGIGMSIIKTMITTWGGCITAANRNEGGAVVTIRLVRDA